MVDAAAPTDPPLPPTPRLGFGAALFLVHVAFAIFNSLLGPALFSTPGAAAVFKLEPRKRCNYRPHGRRRTPRIQCRT